MTGKKIKCYYTNYQGVPSERTLHVIEIYYGTCPPWHVKPQWLMSALDLGKNKVRVFAMAEMYEVKEWVEASFEEWKKQTITDLEGYDPRS